MTLRPSPSHLFMNQKSMLKSLFFSLEKSTMAMTLGYLTLKITDLKLRIVSSIKRRAGAINTIRYF